MAGESIGNAYLNVVPKIDGNAKTLGNNFGTKFSSGAKSTFSAGAVALGNIMSSALMSTASFLGDQFAAAFEAAANFEQLQGGVEKIFDQADTAQIFKDAQDAYKNLNMSANQYLESINQVGAAFAQTMGDQKGYDTAKTGMQAIADYASGTGRSVDELNEKYAMITRATSSYQSIADQFSGILPATSADFLAQAQAAGFLSDEYKKLTEVPVAEYQEAVTKMLEKGVEDMGLAGNTAAESAETISGSIAMLKSSWENFLTAAGDMTGTLDMDKAVEDLKTSIKAVVDNVAPMLLKIGESFSKELPGIIESGITTILSTMPEWLPQLQQLGMDILLAIASGVANGIAPWMEELNKAVEDGLKTISDAASDFFDGGAELAQNVADGIAEGAADVGTGFEEMKALMATSLADAKNRVTALAGEIKTGITSKVAPIASAVKSAFENVKKAMTDPIDKARSLVQGAIDKIKGLFPVSIGNIMSIKLPHISVNGGSAPWGIGGKGSPPSFSVSWYARGGFVDGAQLIGAGEQGPELIWPEYAPYFDKYANAIAERIDGAGIVINLNYDAGADANDMLLDISRGIRQLRAAGAI